MSIQKRDNMGFAIHPILIVLLIILGAGMIVVCGAGISRFAGKREPDKAFNDRTDEQDAYMREVRTRTVQGLVPQGARGDRHYSSRGAPRGRETPSAYSEV